MGTTCILHPGPRYPKTIKTCRKGNFVDTCQFMRQVLVYPGEDSYWVAECPSLPGCISQGNTKEEAISNIKEAIAVYIDALEEDNLPVPPDNQKAAVIII